MGTSTQNVTIRIPRAALRKARIAAARRDTSVSAIVAEYFEGLTDRDQKQVDPEMEMQIVKTCESITQSIREIRKTLQRAIAAVDRSEARSHQHV